MPLTNTQNERYKRHLMLENFGEIGQQKLLNAHVVIVGAGGLGSPAALYLASAGIGKLTLVDHDCIDLSNLQRQILHSSETIGKLKVASAKMALSRVNTEVLVVPIPEKATDANLPEIINNADVVLDCTDNFAARHVINRACLQAKKTFVSGAIRQFSGQMSVFGLNEDKNPCYHCLFPEEKNPQPTPVLGVFAPVVGIIGALLAAEAIKIITGIGEPAIGKLLMYDAKNAAWQTMLYEKNLACAACAK